MKYSATTNAFYDPRFNRDIPADAVEVSAADYADLMAADSAGYRISADDNGRPCLVPRSAVSLDDLKLSRRESVAAACAAAIQGGVVCNALGSYHTYPTTMTDQHNLDGTVLAASIDGDDGGPYKFWCADSSGAWARRDHSAAQIIAVGKAVRAHVVAQQDRYEAKLGEIDAATTAEEIATIVW